MRQIHLKNQYHTVPLSVLAIGENGIKESEKRPFVYWYMHEYIARGGVTLDTARMYGGGESELWVGKFLKETDRSALTVVTKCAHPDFNEPGFRARVRPAELQSDIETSLKTLDTDYVDVLLLHRDDCSVPVEEIMPTLDGFVRAGKVKILGASNWTAGRIAAANRFAAQHGLVPFSVSQINWSLALTTPAQLGDVTSIVMDEAEHAWYQDEQFPVMAWSSAAKGFFSRAAAGMPQSEKVMQRYGWLNANVRRAERAKQLADELQVPVGTLVLAYLQSDPVPTCAVTAFSNKTQFEEAMRAPEVTLTPEQRRFLEAN